MTGLGKQEKFFFYQAKDSQTDICCSVLQLAVREGLFVSRADGQAKANTFVAIEALEIIHSAFSP